MATGRDLITGSLRLIGAVASGETPAANELQDALTALNDMLDSWSTESLVVYSRVSEFFSLVGGQQTYTMGAGGNFNTTRPIRIDDATLQVQGTTIIELPVQILNEDEWASVTVKSISTSIPTYLYSDSNFPLTNISLWPIPNTANKLGLYTEKPLTQVASVSTTLSLPQGYARAIRYNLAVELAPEYGKTIGQEIAQIAMKSKASIKSLNVSPYYMASDPAVTTGKSTFNWRTGE